jgi:hypothetical protein
VVDRYLKNQRSKISCACPFKLATSPFEESRAVWFLSGKALHEGDLENFSEEQLAQLYQLFQAETPSTYSL